MTVRGVERAGGSAVLNEKLREMQVKFLLHLRRYQLAFSITLTKAREEWYPPVAPSLAESCNGISRP